MVARVALQIWQPCLTEFQLNSVVMEAMMVLQFWQPCLGIFQLTWVVMEARVVLQFWQPCLGIFQLTWVVMEARVALQVWHPCLAVYQLACFCTRNQHCLSRSSTPATQSGVKNKHSRMFIIPFFAIFLPQQDYSHPKLLHFNQHEPTSIKVDAIAQICSRENRLYQEFQTIANKTKYG